MIDIIGLIFMTIIINYSVTQIMNFYGIGQEVYMDYMYFYIFIVLCVIVLPKKMDDN